MLKRPNAEFDLDRFFLSIGPQCRWCMFLAQMLVLLKIIEWAQTGKNEYLLRRHRVRVT